jgi:PadR family transcriptional regulator
MTRDALGEFEHHVLLALRRRGGTDYSAPIVMELEDALGKSVAAGAVFVALRRLEQRGYLESTKRQAKPGEGGRGRRLFTMTPAAEQKLRESRATFERFWRDMEPQPRRT